MVPSRYNIIIPIKDKKPLFHIYNTFSDSQAEIGLDVLMLLESGHIINKKRKELLLAKYSGHLLEMGFMVESRKSESKAIKDWFAQKQTNPDELDITILPTFKCNLACIYCFQSNINLSEKNRDMSKKTILRLAEWVGERMDSIHPKRLSLLFYGGEPLLKEREILAFSALISKEAKKRAVDLNIQMITNGTLLSPGFVNALIPFGFESIKVTIDGMKNYHDQLRIEKNNKGTFEAIIRNLLKVKSKIKFIIGSNYNLENFQSIPEMYDYLIALGLQDSISKVNFRPIFQGGANISCDICSFSESNPETQFWMQKEVLRRGLPAMDLLSLGPCGFHKRDAYTIDPEGKVYKCEGLIGIESAELGDLHTGNIEEKSESFIARFDLFGKCGNCGYLPICGGGCRYWAFAKTGDIFGTACEKKYFDYMAKEIITETAKA